VAGEKTEKPTPKRKQEAREKGQVARSMDLTGAVVMLAGLAALMATGGAMAERLGAAMTRTLAQVADPEAAGSPGAIGRLLLQAGQDVLLALAPVAAACAVAAIVVSVAQVGVQPMPKALKPDPKRLNPISGFKNIYGPNALVEGAKSIVKVAAVGVIVAMALLPQLDTMGSLMGIEPLELGIRLHDDIEDLALRAGIAYLVIGVLDFGWQRYRHEKSLKMDLEEVKEEQKGMDLPPEVKQAMRRKQMLASRARMMGAVPEADVVVTNPTHFSVALKYDGEHLAPVVVAKGADLIALKIREVAAEAGVPVVPEPPLARSLYASCEVGDEIPEELYVGVAQVLAWVFRSRGRRVA
jgi:flagellar biosynthesis protein FlhB